MSHNNFHMLMQNILNAPLWVQEVVYLDIKRHLEEVLPNAAADAKPDEVYPAYTPEITFKGKKELETHENGLDFNIYKYLKCALNKQRVIDITLDNFWTLEESSSYLSQCIKMELIKPPHSIILASVHYLSGEIRLGEYVKRLNKIDIKELDDILRKQKHHNEENPDSKLKIGEIMVDMGYVANKDIDKIIHTKSEAKKRYILATENKPAAITPAAPNLPKTPANDELVKKLMIENKLLKDKLRAIFNLQNKHRQQ